MEAYCLLILKRPEEILELLGEDAIITNPAEPVLASAISFWEMLRKRNGFCRSAYIKRLLPCVMYYPHI